jgi:hypothetical protein
VTDELTPEQEADVRRLLTEARHDGPVPADVAARLDATLESLAGSVRAAPVVDLAAARHRRRNAGRLLLAAAAVVVGGVAVGQVVGSTDGADDSPSAESAAQGEPRPNDDSAGDKGAYAAGGGTATGASPSEGAEAVTPSSLAHDQALLDELNAPLRLTSANFEVDVQRALRAQVAEREEAVEADLDGLSAYSADFVCPKADYGPGARLPAYYDAEEAVLVLRRPRAGIQRVDLLACGTAAQLNSVDLPAR